MRTVSVILACLLQVLVGRTSGQLPFVSSPTQIGRAELVAAGDFGGNATDLLITRKHSYLGATLRNDGNGRFEIASWIPVGGSNLSNAVIGDFNQDGIDDVLIHFLSTVRLLLSSTGGDYHDVTPSLPPVKGLVSDVTSGDYDGDGNLDLLLILTDPTVGCVEYFCPAPPLLWFGSGNGTFLPRPSWNPNIAVSGLACSGDFDGDGDTDVFIAQDPTSGTATPNAKRLVLQNDGRSFSVHALTPPSAIIDPPKFITTTPFSSAGHDGVVIVSSQLMAAMTIETWLPQNGSLLGTPTSSSPVVVNWELESPMVADLTGDGRPELALPDGSTLGLDTQDRFANSVASIIPNGFASAVMADFDGDGDADVVAGRGLARLHLNDGAYGFIREPLSRDQAGGVLLTEDLDGDGDCDALIWDQLALHPAMNDGFSRLTSTGALPYSDWSFLACPFDFDGDGDFDVALRGGSWGRILTNQGPNGWTLGPATAGFPNARAVVSGDLNGDGLDDLVYATLDPGVGKVNVWQPNFGGSLGSAVPLAGGVTSGCDIELSDVDQDGDLDIVEANVTASGGPPSRILLNDGLGSFVVGPSFSQSARTVEVADFDGDGVDDVLLDGTVHLNQGLGTFAPAQTVATLQGGPLASTFRDFDGDGLPDLLIDGPTYPLTSFYRNAGGLLEWIGSAKLDTFGTARRQHAVADFDVDGDLDIAQPWGFLACTTRQLFARDWPRPGRPLRMEIRGAPAAPWQLFASFVTLHQPVSPFGTLRIDPAHMFLVGSGTLSNAGDAMISFNIPATPGLDGISVYWQSTVGSPIRLTGTQRTLIQDLPG